MHLADPPTKIRKTLSTILGAPHRFFFTQRHHGAKYPPNPPTKNKLDFCSKENHHLKVEPILAEISGAVA